jgi:hybrid cluster-associated redox disulfide protein
LSTDQDSIFPHLTISAILERWPEVIPIFIKHKMACVGCSLADFMTLEDALEIYQLEKEPFIEQIKEAIQTRKSETGES